MEQQPQSETFGEAFPGFMIELLASPASPKGVELLCWDGTEAHVQSHVSLTPAPGANFKPRVFVPPDLDPTTWRAIRFPTHAAPYESTQALFSDLCTLVKRFTDLPERLVQLASHSVLASWFSDCTAIPICLSIFGPRSNPGGQLFRLLSCLYRRPLILGEMSAARLSSLPLELSPSLFLERHEYRRDVERLLRALDVQDAYVPRKGKLVTLNLTRVVCSEGPLYDDTFSGGAIEIPVTAPDVCLPILDRVVQQQIADEFQPKLLMYRLRNHVQVVGSKFDVPDFSSPVREVARTLGTCVPDAPELQEKISSLLREAHEELESYRGTDLNSIVLETMLGFCHDKTRQSVRVGEITSAVNAILERNGELLELSPRKIGYTLKALGLITKRLDAAGRGILLLQATRERIHSVARNFLVDAADGDQECPHCQPGANRSEDKARPIAQPAEIMPYMNEKGEIELQ
jgi:hypothetical protein